MNLNEKKIGRENDGRYALTPEQEKELTFDVAEGVLSRKEIGLKYGISISKVWQLFNPEQHKKNVEANKKNQPKYYDTKANTDAQRKHREKKAKVYKEK